MRSIGYLDCQKKRVDFRPINWLLTLTVLNCILLLSTSAKGTFCLYEGGTLISADSKIFAEEISTFLLEAVYL